MAKHPDPAPDPVPYEVLTDRRGHRTVHRVTAGSEDDARRQVGDRLDPDAEVLAAAAVTDGGVGPGR